MDFSILVVMFLRRVHRDDGLSFRIFVLFIIAVVIHNRLQQNVWGVNRAQKRHGRYRFRHPRVRPMVVQPDAPRSIPHQPFKHISHSIRVQTLHSARGQDKNWRACCPVFHFHPLRKEFGEIIVCSIGNARFVVVIVIVVVNVKIPRTSRANALVIQFIRAIDDFVNLFEFLSDVLLGC